MGTQNFQVSFHIFMPFFFHLISAQSSAMLGQVGPSSPDLELDALFIREECARDESKHSDL